MITLEDRAELVMAEAWALLPAVKHEAWITGVALEDLGSVHGSYSPEEGLITLSTRLFTGVDAWELLTIDQHGMSPAQDPVYCSRALHTATHETLHAIGYATGLDGSSAWIALSGWEETWEDRQSTGRYFERRPGWGDQGGSPWAYRKGTWFCREYSSKSPKEDFADCGTHIALGWHGGVTDTNGRAKIRHLVRHVWGETEKGRLDAVTQQWRARFGKHPGGTLEG